VNKRVKKLVPMPHRFVSDLVTVLSHRTLFFLDNFVKSCIIGFTNLLRLRRAGRQSMPV